jgi:hypothetical protein
LAALSHHRASELQNEARLACAISGMSGLAFRNEAKFPAERREKFRKVPKARLLTVRVDLQASAEGTVSAKKQNQQIKANLLK